MGTIDEERIILNYPKLPSLTRTKEEYRNDLGGVRSFAKTLLKSDGPVDKTKFKDGRGGDD